jgi:hypothetical protein
MKKIELLSSVLLLLSIAITGQTAPVPSADADAPKQTSWQIKRAATVTFSALTNDMQPSMLIREMPPQSGKPQGKDDETNNQSRGASNYSVTLNVPVIGDSFQGNAWGVSTPNDNDFAISDSGIAISVINTNIYVKNTKTNMTYTRSLAAFTSSVNNYHAEFDPKVIYDPKRDRFAMVVMVGSQDTSSKMVVGFSKTSDPAGDWHLYVIPGNPFGDKTWSDYPMIAMSEKELFLTVNLLYNDSTWQKGFVQTIVWQMKKDSGYAGLPLGSKLHSNIKYFGKMIRNLCPVKGGSKLYGPPMYLLSNRNLDLSNDSVFVLRITDTIGAPGLSIARVAVKASVPYKFPPDGRQTVTSQSLATNDCRNLGAFYENGIIQYVHNTRNPQNNRCSIYYGVISSPSAITPTVTGYILDNDTMDFAYPNISYSGMSPTDNSGLITFDHSSTKVSPGVSAVQADAKGNFSPALRIKTGTTYVNILQGNLERWGDYSGSQRRYNNPGEVWMSGYYGSMATYNGNTYRAHSAWIAQLFTDDLYYVSVRPSEPVSEPKVFPVPITDIYTIDITLKRPEYLNIELYDISGKLVTPLYRDRVAAPECTFTFRKGDLNAGTYFLKVAGNEGTSLNKKIIIQ